MDLRERLEVHKELITDRLDPDFGLLDQLLSSRSLTRQEVLKVKAVPDSYGRSKKLLEYVFDNEIYEKFLEVLRNSEQTHLVNFILGNGERRPEFGQYWPLTEQEISIIDTNQQSLVDLLDISDLLSRLYSMKVVNYRQREFVSSKPTSYEKNEALLEILRRSSLRNYRKMIHCLHASKQSHIAEIFKDGGVVVRAHADLETETNVDEVEDELITKFTEMLSDRSLEDTARILECAQLRLIAAKKGQSILLYFFCKTSAELFNLREMQTSGKLANVVRKTFNEMLSRAQVTNVTIRFSNEDFMKYEIVLHRVGANDQDDSDESLDKDDAGSLASSTTMDNLPLELLDVILEKIYLQLTLSGNRSLQSIDSDIVRTLASVCCCWFKKLTRRRFKRTIWRHLEVFYRNCYKRTAICRNNRSYLLENIQSKSLFNRLRSVDCLTDAQTRIVNRQTDNNRRCNMNTEEFLHLVKFLDASRYSAFVQCLRETKQSFAARVAANGGAKITAKYDAVLNSERYDTISEKFQIVVRAEIQCLNLENRKSAEHQMVQTLLYLRDKVKPKPTSLEVQLDQLKADGIEILDSILDRNPVVWLWCQSQMALAKLQSDSNLLLTLLSVQSIARSSELVRAKTVNVDGHRFRKEVVVCQATKLQFFTRLSIKGDFRVRGLTKLRNSIYVLCRSYSSSPNSIQVFDDQLPFRLLKEFSIDYIKGPEDIGSNEAERCLYVTDSSADRCVWKISTSDHGLNRWLVGAAVEPFTLSLSSDGQLLMVRKSRSVSSLDIYGPSSDLHRSYPLPPDIRNPQHAVETSSGTFLVLHELKEKNEDSRGGPLWSVSEVTQEDHPRTLRRFVPKATIQQIDRPSYLALDSNEQVFVADTYANRVIHLDSDLNWKGVLSLKTRDIPALWSLRVLYDAINHRLMAAGLTFVDFYT